ncbi:MAG: fluoride efflux transporter FluC [Microbacteriaceae bacterium]
MTHVIVFVATCAAGGAGAALRFLADGLISTRARVAYPVATTIINVSGSLCLGILAGAAAHAGFPTEFVMIAGGGLLGGYTTFSTASFETVRLAQEKRYGAAAANGVGMLVVSVAAAALGLMLGSIG